MIQDINFEKNKKELLEKLEALKKKSKEEDLQKQKNTVVIFAKSSLFIEGLKDALKRKYFIKHFENSEEASNFCISNNINKIILDMDSPTDWRDATDVFTTVKTIKPDVRIIISTKEPQQIPVKTLQQKGACVLKVPFSSELLFSNLS
jgi:DNA-binding NarL/FixJ family response regulator